MDIAFGATQVLGALTGWNEQSPESADSFERKSTLDKDGNESDSHLHAGKTEVNVPYVASTDGTVVIPGTIGVIVNSLVLTQIQVNTSADDYVKLSLAAHDHAENPHGTCRSGAHGIGPIGGFGATDFIGGTPGADAAVESSSLTIKCEHIDVNGNEGTHVDGENYHAMIEAETNWHGVPTTAAGSGWDNVKTATKTNNQGLKVTTVTASKKVTLA